MILYHVYVRTRHGWRDLGAALYEREDAAALARDYAKAMRIAGTTEQLRVGTSAPREDRR